MEYYIIGIILLIILIIVFWFILTSNKLNRAKIKIEEADSGIDVALMKRHDVLTKMSEVVKEYAKHEKETLFEIINLRKNMSLNEKTLENEKMSKNLEHINVLVEAYPDLKSNENFKVLQKSIIEVEEHLQAARRVYNSNVSIFNQLIIVFPTNIVANLKKMQPQNFFEAEESKKSNVKINLQ